jgi:hypothetical protein
MSDPEDLQENFLQRWSRRKHATGTVAPDGAEPAPLETKDDDATAEAQSDAVPPAFDVAVLPPIESITAATDIRAFLAPGVPEELTRAALRRVWVTDPTIRDFIGLAENQWDFTKPDSVPGFGSLELTPELRRMVANLFGDAPGRTAPLRGEDAQQSDQAAEISAEPTLSATLVAPEASDASAAPPPARGGPALSGDAAAGSLELLPQDKNNNAAPQPNISEVGQLPRSAHRKHGGALPK